MAFTSEERIISCSMRMYCMRPKEEGGDNNYITFPHCMGGQTRTEEEDNMNERGLDCRPMGRLQSNT